MARFIDRMPPEPTGDEKRDTQAIINYLSYMYEQLNFILSLIYKQNREG